MERLIDGQTIVVVWYYRTPTNKIIWEVFREGTDCRCASRDGVLEWETTAFITAFPYREANYVRMGSPYVVQTIEEALESDDIGDNFRSALLRLI